MYNQDIIKRVCQGLIAADFRSGFEDGVIQRCRAAIATEQSEDAARAFWSDFACFIRRDVIKAAKLLKVVDQEAIDIYLNACEIANGKGSFKMPSWGTRGS